MKKSSAVAMSVVFILVLVLVGCIRMWRENGPNREIVFERTIMWGRIPILVCAEDYEESVAGAVELFNSRTDMGLFSMSDYPCDVFVQASAVDSDGPDGRAGEAYLDESEMTCRIDLLRPLNIRQAMFVVYHELGHCVGLAHDEFTMSVMHPRAPDFADSVPPPWLSDKDSEALRERYRCLECLGRKCGE